ncbi:hypothetical protein LV28_19630 [Pandoraea pnomenusa]|uniref:Pathogenicity island 2 chaperone protein SscA n=1 Tax=Pandoraea pnomenusa TaxID=93220 RepID=A0A378YU39_9BURK|nr:hypothetical protein [Pandoraea pnomenusa]AHB08616.1 hypothetical protein U875_18900 [Pandoraea pnomenusa 3kgm]AIU28479.1 hypothetical protein LV28_19630 [Pandoraea pnomenusa]SUA80682.1 pathogenicity island 2 chaperone protein SscA [Pandoraea pnomenusa]
MSDIIGRYGIAVSHEDMAMVRQTLERETTRAAHNPHLLATVYALAYQLLSVQKLAKAHRYFLLLAQWAPTNTTYLRALGRVQFLRGQSYEALNTFSMCVAFGDVTPELGVCIAECHLALDQRAQAASVLYEVQDACTDIPEHGALLERVNAMVDLIVSGQQQ